MVYYGGAQHSFTVPTAPGANGLAYSPSADKRSQSHLKAFFTEIFGVPER
jgi:dienelactone hydrolase